MENLRINTTQNVAIEHVTASIGERIVAGIIDYAIIGTYAIFISMFVGFSQNVYLFFLLFPVTFYFLVSEISMNGQTWGKRIMSIRVITTDGSQADFIPYFLRWVFRLIDVVILLGAVGLITIILSKKSQRLGDMAANTTVVRMKKTGMQESVYVKLPEDYTITYPEAKKLTFDDIKTIKKVLLHLQKTKKSMHAMHLADKTKAAVEKKLGIKAGMRSEFFLFTLLRDYNYINAT